MSKAPETSLANRMVAKFGGKSALAAAISEPESTVRGWIERSTIPVKYHRPIVDAADRLGITLTEEDWFGRALPKGSGESEGVRT